ncbi:MAG: magnesium chelatase subunit H, partial [Candidatus Electrothrix sp. AW5]|nr:magnesium chelatase subunit H [Candidatus Electrothrix gigas]
MVRQAWAEEVLPDTESARTAVKAALAAARNLGGRLEIENFFLGLEGRYIEPALGGDPLRNPDVLPTGRNSYQFDPRLVPSEEACRRGMQIAENTIRHYKELNEDYPDSTAVILWGFETTKTRGETVGQILGYLGVRVLHNSNPFHKKLEAIPLAELGRPRIDCLVQICGFFRDMYPNVMDMINRAFQLVAELPETAEDNHIRCNTLRLTEELAGQVPEERLNTIATGRIFGPRAGEYGTRTTHLIETGAWTEEEDITDLVTSTMSHLYADGIHGERQPAAYRSRLAVVDAVSQVRDSHEYEIMDLDHYYEYFGGLSRTVEAVKGEAPVMLISDTTKEVIRTETVKESLNRGIRTRLLNPKWIDALLEHDYHGVQKIGDRVENLIG